ncbi:MAG: 16S rRNA (cytosine(967)-C(5))-methyltransferase RsmB [Deltaproteobacteria bacterium]|nr:16S rRNA (cytosine(967)-C(5))-methyltransferase RsmB [Deltaproteobacteria bacterium]
MVAVSRQIAVRVLNRLDQSDETLDAVLARVVSEYPGLCHRDHALAVELAFGVLRWRGRLDWMIEKLASRPLRKIRPRVMNVIRLGLYQLLFLTRIPPSAAVNECVTLAKQTGAPWVAPFVNATLRTASAKLEAINKPPEGCDPVTTLAVWESHPRWMVDRWVGQMGMDEAGALCRANNRIPGITLRTNRLKISRDDLLDALQPHVKDIRTGNFAPDALILKGLNRSLAQMPEFRKGWFQVQDEAAQLVSYLVNPQPGDRILDACAGLGGKTGHLVQLMGDRGEVVALDRDASKLCALRAALARLEVSCVETRRLDLLRPGSKRPFGDFDKILLDAPCSGLGVIRRNPDAKWQKRAGDLKRLSARQQALLEAVAAWVKPGARLVYCVCTFEPEETEAVVEGFLKRHGEFAIENGSAGFPAEAAEVLLDRAGVFRSLPHRHDMDGFFAIRLKRG